MNIVIKDYDEDEDEWYIHIWNQVTGEYKGCMVEDYGGTKKLSNMVGDTWNSKSEAGVLEDEWVPLIPEEFLI